VGSREQIQQAYQRNPLGYDEERSSERGRIIKRHRIEVFTRSLPVDPVGCRTLEVAAGTGVCTLPVLRRGFTVTATDVNPGMLDVLRGKLEAEGLAERCTLRREDLFALSFPDQSFDFVYCMSLLPRLSDLDEQRAGLLELARVVDRGGRLVFNHHPRAWRAAREPLAELLGRAGMEVVAEKGAGLVSLAASRRLPRALLELVARMERRLESRPRLFRNVLVVAEKRA
jgi:ubiquinone/menaquinone biosynthesis C-methylase UbiE